MVGKIIRGALMGIVLGLFIGVALSGAMYMFNYMREGVNQEKSQGLIADGVESQEGDMSGLSGYVPTLNVGENGKQGYDYKALGNILAAEGITGLAKDVATDNWSQAETAADISVEETADYNNVGAEGVDYEETADIYADEEDSLANNLIRFHVRANSNSDVDIALKYKVRDAVIASLEEGLSSMETKAQAEAYLADNLDIIKEIAEDTLSAEDYNYAVKAYITNDYFPMRQYGDMVLPAGFYQALRIDIGLANGENFWCLLYPTMCVPIEAGGVITREGQQELEEALTPEQYDKLFVEKEVPEDDIEIRFKLWDVIFK